MENDLGIIAIDSLDPYFILENRKNLPNFSNLIDESPTLTSKSVFPIDTIPAWASIYTGLHPGNHGVLYVYDVFDPNLSDLKKLDTSHIKGRTFWDYVGNEGYKLAIDFPMLMYPSWEINGVMVSKSPFDRRMDWLRSEVDIDTFPVGIKKKYGVPDKLESLWGGYPGLKHLLEWSELGKKTLDEEKTIGFKICKNENWNLFFIYFSLLDIIQHRLWRFSDKNDPSYPGQTPLSGIILDYYKIFDGIIGEFLLDSPDLNLIVMSDHGHHSRPVKTANLNEYLRQKNYLSSKGRGKKGVTFLRKVILEVASRLDIEHQVMKLVVKNQRITKASKSIYSSSGAIDKEKSKAYLSNFAGIKSYPFGGIEINRDLISNSEYDGLIRDLIIALSGLKTADEEPLLNWIKKRGDVYPGKFTELIYPDILFELKDEYGVGWEVHSDLIGKAYDHKVASGGHAKNGVFLLRNVDRNVRKKDISIVDFTPTVLDLLEIDWKRFGFDGTSIFK